LRKLLAALLLLIVLAALAGAGGLYYIRPDPMLSLEHGTVSLKEKVLEMARSMSPDLRLTEEDVANLLKASLKQNPHPNRDVTVQGADFSLANGRLLADLSLVWRERIPFGMQVVYRLAWRDPDIHATVETVKIRGIELPSETVESLVIPIGRELPELLRIRDVEFGDDGIVIRFQPPRLHEWRQIVPKID
jgi:hypothetical protein